MLVLSHSWMFWLGATLVFYGLSVWYFWHHDRWYRALHRIDDTVPLDVVSRNPRMWLLTALWVGSFVTFVFTGFQALK